MAGELLGQLALEGQAEAKLEQAREKEWQELQELAKLNPSLSFERSVLPPDTEVVLELWESNIRIWEVYKISRNYLEPVFAGMGSLATERIDSSILLATCSAMGIKKNKLLEVLELLPYLHGAYLSKTLVREPEESREEKEDG